MTFHRYRRRAHLASFSLVELLTVLVIVSILAALSFAAFSQISRSTSLSTGAQTLRGALEFARQTAITRDSNVQFRFYQIPGLANNSINYQAYQAFIETSSGTNAVTPVSYLPSMVGISPNATISSVVSSTNAIAGTALNQPIPVYNQNYNALILRFSSKGGLQSTASMGVTSQWFVTLVVQNDPVTGSLPKNFATLQIDPVSGHVSVYRP